MKLNLLALIVFLFLASLAVKAQTLNPTPAISLPGQADAFKGGYTFSYATAGTPWNGALISFGGAENSYDCQISSDYGLNRLSFRTRNADANGGAGVWNPWNEIPTILGNNNFSGTISIGAYQSTSPFSIGNNHGIKLSIGNATWQNSSVIETGYSSETEDFTDIKAASYGYSDGLIRILRNGNVGIGAKKPDSRLTVAGNIHAREVKVTADAGKFPDYVFANDYKLKSLQEVEEYIKQNSHLPEIPSAKEVEANGLMLGEMNMSLLKKIEELTLYMIQQNKVMNELQEANKVMKANQIILESRLAKVEIK